MPRDTLLAHRINQLHLNSNCPFPSEVSDSREFVRKWRLEQRLRLVERPDDTVRDRDSDDSDPDPLEAA